MEEKEKKKIMKISGGALLAVVVVILATNIGRNLAKDESVPVLESENIQAGRARQTPTDSMASGKTDKPIEIHSWEEFKNIGNTDYDPDYTLDADYILVKAIKSDGKKFTPIGTKEKPFTGTFDGKGKQIDVTANPEIKKDAPYSGLFGVVKQADEEKAGE